MRKKLIAIVGPTASDKTDLAVALATKYPFEIISADSRQIYRFMDIGTGKPIEKKGYGLIDIVDPDKDFNVADYKSVAEKAMENAIKKGKIPVLVGGSGLYIRAVLDGLCPAPKADQEIRLKLKEEAKESGVKYLYDRLKVIDRDSAGAIHPNDEFRIIRALEVYFITGTPISKIREKTEKSLYLSLLLGIKWPREELYKRIEKRCDEMIKNGLVDEVRHLLKMGYSPRLKSMDSLGYKEVIGFLEGRYPINDMADLIKLNTRHYAKRQMTWFNKDKRIQWINAGHEKDIYSIIAESIKYIDKFICM